MKFKFYDDKKITGFTFPEEAFLFEAEVEELSCGSIISHNNTYYRVMNFDFVDKSLCAVQAIKLNFNNVMLESNVIECPVCGQYIQPELDGQNEDFTCEICGTSLTAEKISTYIMDVIDYPEVIDL